MEWILSCMSSFVNHFLYWQPMVTAIISYVFHLERNMTWCLSMKFCFGFSFSNWIYHLLSLSPFPDLPSPPSTFPVEYTCWVISFNQSRVNCLHLIWYWIRAAGKLPSLWQRNSKRRLLAHQLLWPFVQWLWSHTTQAQWKKTRNTCSPVSVNCVIS